MKRLIAVALAATLAACSTTSPDVISRNEAQRLSTLQDGVVLSVRPVTVEGDQSGVGAVTGGVIGGVAGSSVGGRRESVAVGVLGAVAGAVIGNAAERMATRESAFEIVLQLANGERRAIVQAQGDERLNPGDKVVLITSGGKTRVVKAAGMLPAPAPAPSAVPTR